MTRSVRIIPAILTDDPVALEKLARQAEDFTDYAQIDIMDGKFVPSNSVTCEQLAALKTKLAWEAHLMVLHPENCVADFRRAGAEKIVFHYEATPEPEKIIRQIRKLGAKVGLAVNLETPILAIARLVKKVDSVLFLAVHPGFYGARFLPEVLDKIAAFRKEYPEMEIGIDGGVKEDNIVKIAGSGVNFICIGSALFRDARPAEAYRRMKALVEAGKP
ncbi:MAG: ribulose-phosphate 3-epimerase [Dehalococcoidales bacterium]|jgi:ribulose-phosphate 3-epimerase